VGEIEQENSRRGSTPISLLVRTAGSLFICKLDMSDRQGGLNEKFWEWVDKHNKK
jgi:hypothetical protein